MESLGLLTSLLLGDAYITYYFVLLVTGSFFLHQPTGFLNKNETAQQVLVLPLATCPVLELVASF